MYNVHSSAGVHRRQPIATLTLLGTLVAAAAALTACGGGDAHPDDTAVSVPQGVKATLPI